ncbi:MAG: hypothetical protein IJ994_03160, partial [Firmicutes bacterium]|nr:hypothetical protein [Bacillota bacterium]
MKNNETKRFISFILTVVMLLGMMPTTTGVAYAAPEYNELKVGKQTTLNGYDEWWISSHSWTSDNPSIISVTSNGAKGTIKAEAVGGPVTITHNYGWGTETWTYLAVNEY